MVRLLSLLVVLQIAVGCHSALGQSSNLYLIAGIGSVDRKTVSQAGLGGEFVFHSPFGAGVEVGAIAGHSSFATFSANGYYHVPVAGLEKKMDPFATVGYTVGSSIFGGSAHMLNFGGGLHYWFHRRIGLRLEGRDLVHSAGLNGSTQLWTFRAGIAFR